MKNYTLTLLGIGASLGVSAFAGAAEAGPKGPRYHLTFVEADADSSGGLTVFEFARTQGPGTPLVEVRKRFLAIDVEGAFEEDTVDPVTGVVTPGAAIPNDLISQEELQAYRALEEKPKSDLGRFDLADFDRDGKLSPDEFGYLVSPKVKFSKIMRKFDKRDTDEEVGYLSRAEFKKSVVEVEEP